MHVKKNMAVKTNARYFKHERNSNAIITIARLPCTQKSWEITVRPFLHRTSQQQCQQQQAGNIIERHERTNKNHRRERQRNNECTTKTPNTKQTHITKTQNTTTKHKSKQQHKQTQYMITIKQNTNNTLEELKNQ